MPQAACCITQHAQPCYDHFEVVVSQQLQDKANKLWQLLQQDLGLGRAKICQAALDLLNGIGPCLQRRNRTMILNLC